jgi:HEAT repeat protein
MQESEEQTSGVGAEQDTKADIDTLNLLVAKLAGSDGEERERARRLLVAIGSPAVARLVESLESPKKQVRWEAAKALADMADPAAAEALVKALEDKIFDVRWLAAEGLIKLEQVGIVPLLKALLEHSDSPWLRIGAHHVLHDLVVKDLNLKELLQPIIDSLEDPESAIETPLIAKTVLDKLVSGQSENR